jgi:enoyl-CoA hydratase
MWSFLEFPLSTEDSDMKSVEGIGTDTVLAHSDGGIGWIVFNNPEKHNALSLEMAQAAIRGLEAFAADDEVRVVVLTGAGGKAFVSGADISEFEKNRASAEQDKKYAARSGGLHVRVRELAKPTIAMINGYCMGGGLALAAACDLRFCSESSVFAIPAAKLSIAYRLDFLSWVVDLVGPSRAKDILFSARRLNAAEALAIGLVNRVLPADQLDATVRDYAKTLVGNAPLSIRASKLTIDELVKDPSERDLELCARLSAECFDSEDFKEGRRAFMEKRKPAWRGK